MQFFVPPESRPALPSEFVALFTITDSRRYIFYQ